MYSDKINELFSLQLNEWELARINYRQLEKVRTRRFSFGSFEVLVQYNPERIRSSAAKVDAKSIGERPCFLCAKNRPPEQRGILYENRLTILINPFPIFKRHLTIPSESHTDQRIRNNFDTMLSMAEAMPFFTIFYNGPQCGASAPDHFHFQAGNHGFIPIENDFRKGKHIVLISAEPGIEIWRWKGYLRGIVSIKGNDRKKLIRVFESFFDRFSEIQPDRPEPMLNILVEYSSEEWIVHIIPRKQHRPTQFFSKGSDQILISPAAVDLGGVIITPREEDFSRITENDIENIFQQVCFEENELPGLLNEII
jgi:ATP adenylyltransferase/5',5'''-P-1,P-4-tetraphosphate phosphorylase II